MADETTKTILECIEQDKPFYVLRATFNSYYGREKIEHIFKTKKSAKECVAAFNERPDLYSDISISEYKTSLQCYCYLELETIRKINHGT